jgi:DNA-binding response OmpR family regulator
MHGGTVEAHSDGEDRGSEFVVRLPLVEAATEISLPRQPRDLLSPMRILVVDDNRDAAESLGMVLTALGADVQIAFDGQTAVDVFGSSDPTVVLLDIGMPGMNGYEVARALRTRFPDRRPAIVALTGWGQEGDRRRAREAGIDHHLTKPAAIEELQGLLADIARRDAPARSDADAVATARPDGTTPPPGV